MFNELKKSKSYLLGMLYLFILSLVFLTYLYTFQVTNIQKFTVFYLVLVLGSISFSIAIADILHTELKLDFLDVFPLKIPINSKVVLQCIIIAFLTLLFASFITHVSPLSFIFSYQYVLNNMLKVSEIMSVAISEELFFRGLFFYGTYLYLILKFTRKYKTIENIPENKKIFAFFISAVISSIFFALYHSYVYMFSFAAIESLFIFGMIASFIYYYTDNLWCSITFHFVYDLCLFILTGMI